MKHIKLFEDFSSEIIHISDLDGETYKKGNSYIKFDYLKDTYNLVEFNDNLDLDEVYSVIGERAVLISELFLDTNESPILIKTFLSLVEENALENDYSTIVLVAEPFKDKRQPLSKLIKFYQNNGYEIFKKLNDGMVMFKDLG